MSYTYLIKCKPTGEVYYGVRTAKDIEEPEKDLWVKYFTSSNYVADLIEEHGKDAFDYEVRRTFDNCEDALAWEQKVLTRMNVKDENVWLNKGTFPCLGTTESNHKAWITRRKNGTDTWSLTEETKKKMSENSPRRGKGHLQTGKNNPMYGRKQTDETKKKISEAKIGTPSSNKGKKCDWVAKRNRANRGKPQPKLQKQYRITDPDGNTFVIKGLSRWAKENGLSAGNLCSVASGKWKQTRGYKCERITSPS